MNNVCTFLIEYSVFNVCAVTEECLLLIDYVIDDSIKLKKLNDLNDEALFMVTGD